LNRLISLAGTIGFSSLLISCGGGGGGGTSVGIHSSTNNTVALKASVYSGDFVGTCFPIANASNYENDAALYAKTALSVGTGSAANAPLISRFDFFDNAACTGQALGTLPNNNGVNALTLVSATSINGRLAHKLTLSFGNTSVSYQAGPTADTVIYGTALRLKLPRVLFTGFTIYDLWSLDNNDLYEGNYTYGADGFPTGLLATPVDTKVATLPTVPEAPCGTQSMSWTSPWGSCQAQTTPKASRVTVQLTNTNSSTPGNAEFTCSNGQWSAPANDTCGAPPPSPTLCPAQTVTWTSGALTCSGTPPLTAYPSHWTGSLNVLVPNSTVGNLGSQLMGCQADGSWTVLYPGTCSVPPPPPPPITDPLQLAQAKNCLACHTVSNPGYTFGPIGYTFPSFQTIATYYRARPPVAGVLENKVKAGGLGVFGAFSMPSNPQVSDADLAILIPWILAQ